jgi:hypothetical protein
VTIIRVTYLNKEKHTMLIEAVQLTITQRPDNRSITVLAGPDNIIL